MSSVATRFGGCGVGVEVRLPKEIAMWDQKQAENGQVLSFAAHESFMAIIVCAMMPTSKDDEGLQILLDFEAVKTLLLGLQAAITEIENAEEHQANQADLLNEGAALRRIIREASGLLPASRKIWRSVDPKVEPGFAPPSFDTEKDLNFLAEHGAGPTELHLDVGYEGFEYGYITMAVPFNSMVDRDIIHLTIEAELGRAIRDAIIACIE